MHRIQDVQKVTIGRVGALTGGAEYSAYASGSAAKYRTAAYSLTELGVDKFDVSASAPQGVDAAGKYAFKVARDICLSLTPAATRLREALGGRLCVYARTQRPVKGATTSKAPAQAVVSAPIPYSEQARRQAQNGCDAGFALRVHTATSKRVIQVGGKAFRALLRGELASDQGMRDALTIASALTAVGTPSQRLSTLKALHDAVHINKRKQRVGDLIGARTLMADQPDGTRLSELVEVGPRKHGSGTALRLRAGLQAPHGEAARGIRLSGASSAAECAALKRREATLSGGSLFGTKTQYDRRRGVCRSPTPSAPSLGRPGINLDRIVSNLDGGYARAPIRDAVRYKTTAQMAALERRARLLRRMQDPEASARVAVRSAAAQDLAKRRGEQLPNQIGIGGLQGLLVPHSSLAVKNVVQSAGYDWDLDWKTANFRAKRRFIETMFQNGRGDIVEYQVQTGTGRNKKTSYYYRLRGEPRPDVAGIMFSPWNELPHTHSARLSDE